MRVGVIGHGGLLRAFSFPETSLAKSLKVQNITAFILTGTRKYNQMRPVLYKLYWLLVKYRIKYKIIGLPMTKNIYSCYDLYRTLNRIAPNYLRDLLQVYQSARLLQSSGDLICVVGLPRTRLKSYGDRVFSVKAPSLWNSLPTVGLWKQFYQCPLLRKC